MEFEREAAYQMSGVSPEANTDRISLVPTGEARGASPLSAEDGRRRWSEGLHSTRHPFGFRGCAGFRSGPEPGLEPERGVAGSTVVFRVRSTKRSVAPSRKLGPSRRFLCQVAPGRWPGAVDDDARFCVRSSGVPAAGAGDSRSCFCVRCGWIAQGGLDGSTMKRLRRGQGRAPAPHSGPIVRRLPG